MINTVKVLPFVVAAFVLSGCQSTATTYYWGRYNAYTYMQYNNPAKADAQKQIAVLEEDVQKAKAKNLPVHPGLYAQVGYQYALLGNKAKAIEYFEMEKQAFPESTTYMNLLIKKIG